MSRGLGRIQRRVLDVLKHEVEPIPTSLLTVMVFSTDEQLAKIRTWDKQTQFMALAIQGGVQPRHRNTVNRACHKLWYDCHVSKYNSGTSTWWSMPQAEKPPRKKRRRGHAKR